MKTNKSLKIFALALLGFPLLTSNAPAPVYYAEEVSNYSDFKIEEVSTENNYLTLTVHNYGNAFIDDVLNYPNLHIYYLNENGSDLEKLVVNEIIGSEHFPIYPGETSTITTNIIGDSLNIKAENIVYSYFSKGHIYLSEEIDVSNNCSYKISTSNNTNEITFEAYIPNYYNYQEVYTASIGFYYYDNLTESLKYNVATTQEFISSRRLTLEKTVKGDILSGDIIFENLTLYLETDINSPYYRNSEEKEIVGLVTLFTVLSLVVLTPIFIFFLVRDDK